MKGRVGAGARDLAKAEEQDFYQQQIAGSPKSGVQ